MPTLDMYEWLLVVGAGCFMALMVLHAVGNSAVAVASGVVHERRKLEQQRQLANAAAEAAGRAAALEPLALNPDGSIEEPILAMVEGQEENKS